MKLRFLCVIFGLCGFAAAANACNCTAAAPGQCAGLQPSDTVFLGTVMDVQPVAQVPLSQQLTQSSEAGADAATPTPTSTNPSASPITRYHFRIDERFAGPNAAEIDVFSGGDDGDCGFKFEKGAQYVVYTQPEGSGQLFATICSGTRPASEAVALIPQLRAMRDRKHVAAVFGVLRRSDPPFLTPTEDPDDPVANTSVKLRSQLDRFQSNTDSSGVFSFYDVNAGEYNFSADLPDGSELTRRAAGGALPSFTIPDGACYEYNVDELPTGHIRGSVVGPDGKPLEIAALELYRAGSYADAKPGYWTFQGMQGVFDFAHVGPGKYLLVYNRTNRMDPNSPFPRMFYPGVANVKEAQPIELKDGEDLHDLTLKVSNGYPVRTLQVHLKWTGPEPDGEVTVAAHADHGENPAADFMDDGLYSFTLFRSTHYTISAWENLEPAKTTVVHRVGRKLVKETCALPAKIEAEPVTVSGADAKDVTLFFPKPACVTP